MIRIGNAGGYWGDDLDALRRQLTGGPLDYVTMDFLAEITMSILRKQQLRNPELGYAGDFLTQLETCLPLALDRGVKIGVTLGSPQWLKAKQGAIERHDARIHADYTVRRTEVAPVNPVRRDDQKQE